MTDSGDRPIYKTLLPMESSIVKVDTIEHEGFFWLVPEWLEYPDRGLMQPARIIRLLLFGHQDLRGSSGAFADFLVSNPIPKEIWDGAVLKLSEVVVCIQKPNIWFPIPPVVH